MCVCVCGGGVFAALLPENYALIYDMNSFNVG